MISDLKHESFTHCKCQNCQHLGKVESFNPRLVNVEDSNNPHVTFTPDPGSEGLIQTMDFNCPLCNSPSIEPLYANEVN